MPSNLEAEIGSLLKSHGDMNVVADELLARLRRGFFGPEEQADCFQFLVAAGLLPTFFNEFSSQIDARVSPTFLPWAQFVEALGVARVKLEDFDFQALFDAAESMGATADLVRSRRLDAENNGFHIRRATIESAKLKDANERKQALKDKLNYMRANRMFEQEALVLDELQALFPDENEIKAAREALDIRWAREVVAHSTSQTDPTADLSWKIERLTAEQVTAKGLIVQRANEIAETDARLAYDLAVGLHMMDFHVEALDVLEYAELGRAAEWLKLELMVRARQFVTALDEAARLEVSYADDPDAAFAVTYVRARALYGLGQTGQAIELLRSLLHIRPHYKSAQSLLRDWVASTGGDV